MKYLIDSMCFSFGKETKSKLKIVDFFLYLFINIFNVYIECIDIGAV